MNKISRNFIIFITVFFTGNISTAEEQELEASFFQAYDSLYEAARVGCAERLFAKRIVYRE